jgi:hypothetical protein
MPHTSVGRGGKEHDEGLSDQHLYTQRQGQVKEELLRCLFKTKFRKIKTEIN